MNIPIILALVTLITGGISRFCTKVAGENQVYSPSYMIVSSLCLCLIGVVIHFVHRQPFELSANMAGIAAIGGTVGGIGFYTMLLALRLGGEGSIIFPIAGLGLLVAVPLSFIVFKEPITGTKLLGLGLSVSSIIVLSR